MKVMILLKKILFLLVLTSTLTYFHTLTYVSAANDSRVTVIILEEYGQEIIHNEAIRGVLNDKLLKMGFKPVIDANHVISLNDAQLLNNVYKDYPDEFIRGIDNVTDYLVIGRCAKGENNISIMDYETGKMIESPLKSVKVNLKIDVIVYDTGEILSTFLTNGIGFANNLSLANDKAVKVAANEAAIKLEETFTKISEQNTFQIFFKIFADNEEVLEKILEELNSLDVVNFMRVYERRGSTAVLLIDSYYPTNEIVNKLKEFTNLKVYIEKMTANSCELKISNEVKGDSLEKKYATDNNFKFDSDS